jgi:hypothetical protein
VETDGPRPEVAPADRDDTPDVGDHDQREHHFQREDDALPVHARELTIEIDELRATPGASLCRPPSHARLWSSMSITG